MSDLAVRILIDHPASYRDWRIVKEDSVSGFYHLVSRFKIGGTIEEGVEYTAFVLVLHESEFPKNSFCERCGLTAFPSLSSGGYPFY